MNAFVKIELNRASLSKKENIFVLLQVEGGGRVPTMASRKSITIDEQPPTEKLSGQLSVSVRKQVSPDVVLIDVISLEHVQRPYRLNTQTHLLTCKF